VVRTPLAAVVSDSEGRVVFANPPACAMLGLPVSGGGWDRDSGETDEAEIAALDARWRTQAGRPESGWYRLGVADAWSAREGEPTTGHATVWAARPAGEGGPEFELTKREREILGLVAAGLLTDQIGERLAVSPETVKSHIHNAMIKLRAHTRSQAVAIALSTGQVVYDRGSFSGA
jgi:DNA-binding CsgD family transcriptional regulator